MRISKPYSIQKVDNEHIFVIAKDYRGIDYVLPFINEELKAKKYTGFVIFDLLLSNGNNSRRFFNSFFDGCSINQTTFIKISPAPESYVKLSNRFIKHNPEVLTQGVLRSSDIEKFRELLKISD